MAVVQQEALTVFVIQSTLSGSVVLGAGPNPADRSPAALRPSGS